MESEKRRSNSAPGEERSERRARCPCPAPGLFRPTPLAGQAWPTHRRAQRRVRSGPRSGTAPASLRVSPIDGENALLSSSLIPRHDRVARILSSSTTNDPRWVMSPTNRKMFILAGASAETEAIFCWRRRRFQCSRALSGLASAQARFGWPRRAQHRRAGTRRLCAWCRRGSVDGRRACVWTRPAVSRCLSVSRVQPLQPALASLNARARPPISLFKSTAPSAPPSSSARTSRRTPHSPPNSPE